MKDAEADDESFVFGLIVGAFKVKCEREVPSVLLWRLNDDSHTDRR